MNHKAEEIISKFGLAYHFAHVKTSNLIFIDVIWLWPISLGGIIDIVV